MDIMKKDFIYLDWNAIKYLKDNGSRTEFAIILDVLKLQYLIPYSFAHLCDLQKNMSDSTMRLINSDLAFLKELTSSYMLGKYKDDFDIDQKSIDQKFEEVKSYNLNIFPNPMIPSDIIDEMKTLGLKNYFQKEENIKWYVPTFLKALNRFECDPVLYNLFREIFTIEAPIKELQFFNKLSENPITSQGLIEVVNCFIKFNNTENLCTSEKLRLAYLLLDFNSKYREKINKKTNFTNMYTDCEHMLNASHAKYYLSQDSSTRIRTRFVYDTYNIGTKVYSIDEFISVTSNLS
ncbi:hypothetical protein SDC9_51096 [bioreactor metagenome]|uniref:Uncharacterized protein n=2 Tax=root TaxID=1 RepID=A0A644WLQ7_9ZZZZ